MDENAETDERERFSGADIVRRAREVFNETRTIYGLYGEQAIYPVAEFRQLSKVVEPMLTPQWNGVLFALLTHWVPSEPALPIRYRKGENGELEQPGDRVDGEYAVFRAFATVHRGALLACGDVSIHKGEKFSSVYLVSSHSQQRKRAAYIDGDGKLVLPIVGRPRKGA